MQFRSLIEQAEQRLLPLEIARHGIDVVHAHHAAVLKTRERLRRQRVQLKRSAKGM